MIWKDYYSFYKSITCLVFRFDEYIFILTQSNICKSKDYITILGETEHPM